MQKKLFKNVITFLNDEYFTLDDPSCIWISIIRKLEQNDLKMKNLLILVKRCKK